MRTAQALIPVVAVLALLFSGCESSQDKAKRISQKGAAAFAATGAKVTSANPDIKVVGAGIVTSADGAAAVVLLHNGSNTAQAKVPVSIDVKNAQGKTVFRNNDPGLDPSLTSAAVVPPGHDVVWVHDQVYPDGKPASVTAKVGPGKAVSGSIPKIEVTTPRLNNDTSSGIEGTGKVINHSKVEQKDFVISAVALRGNKIVAAGRAQIERLKVGSKKVPYNVFFIGNPSGARVLIEAPPTTLR